MNFEIFNNIIKKEEILCSGNRRQEEIFEGNAFHIAYGIDNNFVMPMGVSIVSILENNKHEHFVFHVLTEEISENNCLYLRRLVNEYNTIIYIHYINGDIFNSLPNTDHFTKATYNRFLLPKILKKLAKKVIYLDADILCLAEITNLKNIDLSDKIVAVVQDVEDVANRQIKNLQLKGGKYFNAGFLYIDIDRWNTEQVSEQAMQYSFENLGKLKWLDQDALNVVLDGKALFIEEKYDYIFDFGLKKNKNILTLPQDTVFVHYTGRYKPWHQWCMHPLKNDFIKYFEISPWENHFLSYPKNYKEMKRMALSYFLYGQVSQGLKWYIKYSYNKLKEKL